MAKIHKFGLANSLLDSPMATWLTLTGTMQKYLRQKNGCCRKRGRPQLRWDDCVNIDLRKAEKEAKVREMANKREQFRGKNNESSRTAD